MILPVIAALSSGIVVKKMQVMPIFSSRFKELWEEWELRGVVFLSLTLQILLICLGNRRKYIHSALFMGGVWLAYLMADSVAIYALGMITNKLTESNSQSVDTETQLNAFWAPFLLLHLGGPDTITAYALEDNELWLRHLLALVTQAGVTFYIFLMAWNGQKISILTIVVILAGLVKYGERVYVLWTASSEQFRDSIPDPPFNYSKILEQHELMKAEGYDVIPHEVIEVRNVDGANLSSQEDSLYKRKQGELLAARDLVITFQRLFADLLLSFEDCNTSKSVLKGKDPLSVFKIIEIELGIMYDLLYTKAKAIHTSWGLARRITGLVSICIVLVLFILTEDQNYSVVDLYLTFILLAVAIFLEIYALVFLLFADKTACWFIKEKKFAVLNFINWLQPLTKRRRWSDHMAQYSLLSFASKEKHLACHRLLEFLHIDEKVEKPLYKHHKKVTKELKILIMSHFNDVKSQRTSDPQKNESLRTNRESRVLEKFAGLKWSIDLEFDQSILIWHIATELCYHAENRDSYNDKEKRIEISECLSRYMLYILVMFPMMLPTGIGRIKFQETYVEAMKLFDELKSIKRSEDTEDEPKSKASESKQNEVPDDDWSKRSSTDTKDELEDEPEDELILELQDEPEDKPEDKPEDEPEYELQDEPEDEPEDKPEDELILELQDEPEDKPEDELIVKLEDEPEYELQDEPEDKPEDEPEDKPEDKPEDELILKLEDEPEYELQDEPEDELEDEENIQKKKCSGFCAGAWKHINKRKKHKFDIKSACNQLRKQVKTKLILTVAKGDRSKYVLFHACRLASQLDEIKSQEEKWNMISEVWVEMLCYAASKCKGSYHAQQLRRGGELLTHVWLVMAHFGLTDHFQIPPTPAIAKLIMQ